MQKLILSTLIISAILAVGGCSGKVSLDHLLASKTPYEQYVSSLNKASLQQTLLGKRWLEAGEKSLRDSLYVALPHAEKGYFTDESPTAVALRYSVQQGQAIRVSLLSTLADSVKFFMDIFELNGNTFEPVMSSDTLRTLTYEVEESGIHVLRLQPELLVSSGYDLRIESEATLGFPVAGKDRLAVGSFFGAPRDGGQRSHKGIDIFASRGTPVVAAYDGTVSPKMQNRLGGKVVWLSNLKKKFNQYYAHLDSQIVNPGQRIARGDTLGFVGNTGNARTTPPHLHFGLYAFGRGAVDPYPFVITNPLDEAVLAVDTAFIGREARIQTALANIRQAPTTEAPVLQTVSQYTPIQVSGATGKWYRVQLPDGMNGFVHRSLIQKMDAPLSTLLVTEANQPYLTLYPQQSLAQLWAGQEVKVLASYQSHWYVETSEGERLWLLKSA